MRPHSFLGCVAATAAGLALLGGVLAVLIDPYRFYGTKPVPGLTAMKPQIYREMGLAKTYQLERVKPKTLLLGNSRVEIGIDPESPMWPKESLPVFDAAEAGRGLFDALLMLREAIAVSPPRTVVLGLDFQDFLQGATPPSASPPPSDDELRLLVDRDGRPNPYRSLQVWRDRGSVTLTISAFYDGLMTILDQDPATTATMTSLGYNPLHEYLRFVRQSGYCELFAQKNADYEQSYRNSPRPDFSHPDRVAGLRYLHTIMAVAAEHRVRLILYIHPYHSDYLEMLHRLGLWNSFEEWKRTLVREVEADQNAQEPLFDFADYNAITTERVPPRGDTQSEMRWYWDSGHYKSALGDKLLAAMFGRPQWGRILTSQNIESSIATIRENRDRFFTALN